MDLLIYGAGGFAREVAWLAEGAVSLGSPDSHERTYRVVGFIDDHGTGDIRGVPIMSLPDAIAREPAAHIVIAVGDPAVRERLARRIADSLPPATLVDVSSRVGPGSKVGDGSIICAGSIVTCDVTIGRHVHINLDCTVGHDATLGDFATLAPGVHVSGWVHIEQGAYIGTGANIINGTKDAPLSIGAGAVVGAGACVTRSIPAGVTAVGVPARSR